MLGNRSHEMYALQEQDVTFKLQLNCIARKSHDTKALRFNSFPSSIHTIKKAIEDHFSIPTCVQKISYQGITIRDDSFIDTFKHVRSGDTLTVDYRCEADVREIYEVVDWIKKVTRALIEEKNMPQGSPIMHALILEGSRNRYHEILPTQIFDWLDAKAYVNKIHFMECGGLVAILDLYSCILEQEWKDMPPSYKFLESFCSLSLANFGETFYFRRVLLKNHVLEMAMRSVTRIKMKIGGDFVVEETDSLKNEDYGSTVLKLVLDNALHIICK